MSKSNSLIKIAYDGHVYHFSPNQDLNTIKNTELHDLFKIKKIGIKNASVFPGFCKYHDNLLFKDIDESNIEINK